MDIFFRTLLVAGSIALSALSLWAYADQAPLGEIILDEVDIDLDSSLVEVRGRVAEKQTLASMDVNGIPVIVDGEGAFLISLPMSSAYAFNLYRESGVYQTVEYAPVDTGLDSALQLVVSERFLQKSKPPIARLLTNIDLVDILHLGEERCAVDTVFLYGCDFYITQLRLNSEPTIDELYLDDSDGERLIVNMRGRIHDADLSGKLKRMFFGYRNTTMNVRDVDFTARFEVTRDEDEKQSIVVAVGDQGSLDVRIGQMRVTRSDNYVSYMLPYFKSQIELLLSSQFVRFADPFLAELPVPVLPETLALQVDAELASGAGAVVPVDTEVLFALPMGIEALDVVGAGDAQVLLGGTIMAVEPLPGRSVLGTRRLGAAFPMASAVEAPTDVRSQISVDFINRLLAAVYQAGIDQNLSVPVSIDAVGDLKPQLLAFGVPEGGEVRLGIEFGGLPEVSGNSRGVFPVGIEALLPRATLEVWTPGGDGKPDLMLLSVVADFYVNTSMAAQNDGSLQLDFNDVVEVNLIQINGGALYEAVSGLPEELLFTLLEAFVPIVIGELEPFINQLLNAPRLDLDLAEMLGQWLTVEFQAPIEVSVNVTEAAMAEDAASVTVGIALEYK